MILDGLMVEFEDHFKCRLLSVADGTIDSVYSQLQELLRYIQEPCLECHRHKRDYCSKIIFKKLVLIL